jgi:hypothetical protein
MLFALLTLLSALALSAVAAYFSIIGITTIYAATFVSAVVMGIVLESGKLISISWLYRNWKDAPFLIKLPLVAFTLTLMLITNVGVFGYLSSGHLEQSSATINNADKITRLDQQIATENANIESNNKIITQLDATINSYIGKDRADRSVYIRRKQDPERTAARNNITSSQKTIDDLSNKKLDLQSAVNKTNLEVGPIRYISELVHGDSGDSQKNIDRAVIIYTLMIVFTFEPLAVILLMAANYSLLKYEENKKNKSKASSKDTLGIIKQSDESVEAEQKFKIEEINEKDKIERSPKKDISESIPYRTLAASKIQDKTSEINNEEDSPTSPTILFTELAEADEILGENKTSTPKEINEKEEEKDKDGKAEDEPTQITEAHLKEAIVKSLETIRLRSMAKDASINTNSPIPEKISPIASDILNPIPTQLITKNHFIPTKLDQEVKLEPPRIASQQEIDKQQPIKVRSWLNEFKGN